MHNSFYLNLLKKRTSLPRVPYKTVVQGGKLKVGHVILDEKSEVMDKYPNLSVEAAEKKLIKDKEEWFQFKHLGLSRREKKEIKQKAKSKFFSPWYNDNCSSVFRISSTLEHFFTPLSPPCFKSTQSMVFIYRHFENFFETRFLLYSGFESSEWLTGPLSICNKKKNRVILLFFNYFVPECS